MQDHLVEKRPSWWLLYAIAALMVALVAIVETSVADERARMTLEIVAIIAVFALMLRWVRANRGRIELAEAAETQKSVVETALANGQPALAGARTPHVTWPRAWRGGRRPA